MTDILNGHSPIDPMEIGDDVLAEITLILELRRNFSMAIYKDKCMKRRIALRMRSCRCQDPAEYCNLLRQSDSELDLLKKALTIHVSQFFRNPSQFQKLQAEVLPYLFQKTATDRQHFKFYSLGCAGGEEAYTLAIILRTFFSRELLYLPVDILAFDIESEILEKAQKAEYTEDRLNDLPASLRERYFTQTESRMQLSTEIRKMVTFHHKNIMDVGSFEPCQLALCRNTLIYFTRPDQEKILHGIAQILVSGGILLLGKSETLVGDARKLFVPICSVERIYRRL